MGRPTPPQLKLSLRKKSISFYNQDTMGGGRDFPSTSPLGSFCPPLKLESLKSGEGDFLSALPPTPKCPI